LKLQKHISYFHKGRVQCFSIQGCNKQVFSPKPWKKFSADPSCTFREKAKNAHFNSETFPYPQAKVFASATAKINLPVKIYSGCTVFIFQWT